MATLVTGAGYIGSALVRRIRQAGERVTVLDNCYSTSRAAIEGALPAGVEFVEGDVADAKDVGRAFDRLGAARTHDIRLFHLAAQPSAGMAVREPEVTERSNLVGARVVLEAARERGAAVVFGGSFRVYGDELAGQCVDEGTPYGRVGDLSHLSKVYVEQLARMLGAHFASVRLGVTYGLSPIMKTSPAFMTVPNLFCQRAVQGDVLNVLEDRPMAFIHVEDAASALLAAAGRIKKDSETLKQDRETFKQDRDTFKQDREAFEAVKEEGATFCVFNAAPEVATIGEVARTVQRLMRERGRAVRIQSDTPTHPERFEVHSTLDFQPRYTLSSGLGDVLDFFDSSVQEARPG